MADHPTYPVLDGSTLAIASLADLPKQPVHMYRPTSFLSANVQQIRVSTQPPVVDSSSPVIVTRRSTGNGNLQFRVQFIAPTQAQDPNYQTTSISLSTPNGTVTLAGSGGVGPIVFNAPQSSAPANVVVNQTNNNASSNTKQGSGSSRAIVQGL
jgi:hypothetical protein